MQLEAEFAQIIVALRQLERFISNANFDSIDADTYRTLVRTMVAWRNEGMYSANVFDETILNAPNYVFDRPYQDRIDDEGYLEVK